MSNVLMRDVLARLIQRRSEKEMSQEAMADMLKMGRAQYCHMENKRNALSFSVLNGLYHHDWDVDYIITGEHYSDRHSLLEKIILACGKEKRERLYFLMITGFEKMWNWDEKSLIERGLRSEIKAMIMLMTDEAELKEKLYYIRRANRISQQALANKLGIGRTKSSSCERGEKKLDAELMLILYEAGYSLPSFYMEQYAGIAEIAHLLKGDAGMKRRYYEYIRVLLAQVIDDSNGLALLQKSGVLSSEENTNY